MYSNCWWHIVLKRFMCTEWGTKLHLTSYSNPTKKWPRKMTNNVFRVKTHIFYEHSSGPRTCGPRPCGFCWAILLAVFCWQFLKVMLCSWSRFEWASTAERAWQWQDWETAWALGEWVQLLYGKHKEIMTSNLPINAIHEIYSKYILQIWISHNSNWIIF